MFRDQLKAVMSAQGLSQAELSRLTGIGKPSISQYLNGTNKPTQKRQRVIAEALGLPGDYFSEDLPEAETETATELTVTMAARLMGKSRKFVEQGLQQGTCPFGYAVKMGKWCYYISPYQFTKYTGIEL